MTTKIIIDTDPGVDDTMAIAYALEHPELELLALTTVFGNADIDLTTRNAQYVLDRMGASDVAVARGADKPLKLPPATAPDFVHGKDGLGNVYPGSSPEAAAERAATLREGARHAKVDERDAADYLIDCSRRFPGEITIVAIGPLTNIAEACRRDPTLASRTGALIIMGGCLFEPGNVTPLAEANFFSDPHAADEVLAFDWPVTIVGLDVTHEVLLYDSDLERLREAGGASGTLIWESSRFYVDFYSERGAAAEAVGAGAERACAMHDASALVYAVMPDAFDTLDGGARVVSDGIAMGQLAIDRRGFKHYSLPYWDERPPVAFCRAVDAARVRDDFLNTILQRHTS